MVAAATVRAAVRRESAGEIRLSWFRCSLLMCPLSCRFSGAVNNATR
jgi:hypothetical protein